MVGRCLRCQIEVCPFTNIESFLTCLSCGSNHLTVSEIFDKAIFRTPKHVGVSTKGNGARFCLARVSRRLATASTSVRSFSAASKVLIMGLGGPKGPPPTQVLKTGLTKEKIMAMLKEQNDTQRENGVSSTMILIDYTQHAASRIEREESAGTLGDRWRFCRAGDWSGRPYLSRALLAL